MQFSIKTSAIDRIATGCAIVPVLAGGALTPGGRALDVASGKRLSAALSTGDLPAKVGCCLLVHLAGVQQRVLLVSMGEAKAVTEKAWLDAVRAALREAGKLASADVLSLLHEVPVAGRKPAWRWRAQVVAARDLAYRSDQLKSKPDTSAHKPDAITLAVSASEGIAAQNTVKRATALANGMDLARNLGNLPGNVCTPEYLGECARKLGKEFGFKVEVLEEKQLQALKMGSMLAVSRGSDLPPRFIVMHYQGGGAKQAPVVLVGKGITFDTGGISIKPAGDMDEMKYDMSGAGSVLGTFRAIAEMKLRINVVGLVPTCENMPSGRATRPGDIVTSMSGQTIEILNTDAEGRLILCDALTYAERFKPAAVIDIATLTGACVVALGHHHSGLFSPDDGLATELLAAGRETGDTCWRMPVDDAYQDGLKSNFADMANVGGRAGGAITAACFLARYTKAYTWAHLDVAGTAWRSGAAKGSSARPVPLLTQFLMARTKA